MKTAYVVKKDGRYLVDCDVVSSDNYTEDIDEAGIIETEFDAEDIVATGKIEGITGEVVVKVTIEIKEA